MPVELEEKCFKIIDSFLKELIDSKHGKPFFTYGKPYEFSLAKNIMDEYGLIKFRDRSNPSSLIDITPTGINVLNGGGFKKFLKDSSDKKQEIENLELQKLKLENEKLKSDVSNLRTIKLQRNILFVIAIIETVIVLIKSIL